MRRVAFVIFDYFQALDLTGPMDVFHEANTLIGSKHYHLTTLASKQEAISASNGMRILPDATLRAINEPFDTVIVAGGPHLPYDFDDPDLLAWLPEIQMQCNRCCSICTGAFILGRAGLLKGKRATTHWLHSRLFEETFKDTVLEPDKIFVQSGNVFTSAGITAGIDLSLALVREDHGPDLALQLAKRLLIVAHRQGGQSQFSPLLAPPPSHTSPLSKTLEYISNNIAIRMTHSELASVTGMTERTFARTFFKEMRLTPLEYIELYRLEMAKSRIESTTFSMKSIAFDCGFGSAENMRLAFIRHLGLSPRDYRRQFSTRRSVL